MSGTILIFVPGSMEADLTFVRLQGGTDLPRRLEPSTQTAFDDGERTVAAVPGERVAVHFLDIAGSTTAQRIAAARFQAAELTAAPLDSVHIAVADSAEFDNRRAVAVVSSRDMSTWLARLRAHGVDPDVVTPLPMLMPVPEEGVSTLDEGGDLAVRGRETALTAAPELARRVIGRAPVTHFGTDAEARAALMQSAANPALNLRQGRFAKQVADAASGRRRRLVAMAAAIPLVMLAAVAAEWLRYDHAADALEREARLMAGRAVPGAEMAPDPAAALIAARVQGDGAVGVRAAFGTLFDGVRASPGVTIEHAEWRGGTLSAELRLAGSADTGLLRSTVETGGYTFVDGPQRPDGADRLAEVELRIR